MKKNFFTFFWVADDELFIVSVSFCFFFRPYHLINYPLISCLSVFYDNQPFFEKEMLSPHRHRLLLFALKLVSLSLDSGSEFFLPSSYDDLVVCENIYEMCVYIFCMWLPHGFLTLSCFCSK